MRSSGGSARRMGASVSEHPWLPARRSLFSRGEVAQRFVERDRFDRKGMMSKPGLEEGCLKKKKKDSGFFCFLIPPGMEKQLKIFSAM